MDKNYNPMESYKQSKLANILFTLELSKRFENTSVKVVSVSPGIVFTNLGRYHIQTYGYISYLKLLLMYPLIKYAFKSPSEGAQTSIFCCTEDYDKLKNGQLYRNCGELNITSNGLNEEDAKRLWTFSETLVNTKF
jgi:retinol dehydrogenase-13